MNDHLIMSNITCSKQKCNKKIKFSIIKRKQNASNLLCFDCFRHNEFKKGHQMRTAKEIRNNINLRADKREKFPLKLKAS